MGAEYFIHTVSGPSAQEAFDKAVADAAWDHGHSGYTGTIAEKDRFIFISLPEGLDPKTYAESLIDDPRTYDKWGPAGCLTHPNTNPPTFTFFGWASS
jgi:hypothetical protein